MFSTVLAHASAAKTAPKSSNSTYFSFDNAKIDAATAELSDLESYVLANEGVTYSQLEAEQNSLVANAQQVNGLGVDSALSRGDGMAAWAIVLIVLGGLLLIGLVVCCLIALANPTPPQ